MEKTQRPRGLNSRIVGIGGILVLLCSASTSLAQLDLAADQTQGGRVANYRFADASELTITVSLIGAVRQPGRYEISRSVDLMNLLALAGGWTEMADLSDVHVNRAVGGGEMGERRDLKLDFADFQNVSRSYLTLQHGDFIYVGTKSGVNIDRILSWVTTGAIIATTYFTIVDRQR
jgi:hypothetical protein